MKLVERLRGMVQELRRTPKPISDVVPLLQQAADRIEQLECRIKKIEDDHNAATT